jgi:hypothetical protein
MIEGKEAIKPFLEYCTKKYGNDLTLLYEKEDVRGANEKSFH